MKRKLDKKKVLKFLGQATLVILFNVGMSAMMLYGFMTATTLN